MKCIDNTLFQNYIDGETTPQETEMIKKHINGCSQCAQIFEQQRIFATNIKTNINKLVNEPIKIPDFIVPAIKKRHFKIKIRHIVYAVSAACAIIAVLFLFPKKSQEIEYRLIYCFDGEFDSNKTYAQQEMVIKMIDSNGKIISYEDFLTYQ
ncbi:MAG: zf-HC2 domain-containing protein [Marinilabiliaceae bacterium]|nr:zf-HC2 domain-containing protein [Marinilabiliaceae bacterium]